MSPSPASPIALAPPRGHWRLDVYEGEIERATLTDAQAAENAFWAERAKREEAALRSAGLLLADQPWLPRTPHVGAILNPLLDRIEGDNLVVTTGKNLLLDRLFAVSGFGGAVNSMGVGNSATAAVVGDTQLGGSTPSPVLQALDSTPTRSGLVVTTISTFATGTANQTWAELGLFNGTTNGSSTMFNRIAPIGPLTKTSALSIAVTVTVTQS